MIVLEPEYASGSASGGGVQKVDGEAHGEPVSTLARWNGEGSQ